MMDCKKALVETEGDLEKAMTYLREKSLAASNKKANRIAAEGIVEAFISADRRAGVLLEVNCETDFVAKNEDFKALVNDIAKHIAAKKPLCVEGEAGSLLSQPFEKNSAQTVAEAISEVTARIGEKISARRFAIYEAGEAGVVDAYIHLGGKIGVLVDASCESGAAAQNEELRSTLHDIAMHIAASKPTYISKADVNADEIEKEKEILFNQAMNEPNPKPKQIIEKMVLGRIEKYYKEVCLLEQPFVKEPEKTIAQIVAALSAKVGAKVEIRAFTRYEMGEGLEKKQDNFAEEVMSQMQK